MDITDKTQESLDNVNNDLELDNQSTDDTEKNATDTETLPQSSAPVMQSIWTSPLNWKIVLTWAIILICGIIIGAAGALKFTRRAEHQIKQMPEKQIVDILIERLTDQYKLTTDQQKEARAILDKHVNELYVLRKNLDESVQSNLEVMEGELAQILDATQRTEWDKTNKRPFWRGLLRRPGPPPGSPPGGRGPRGPREGRDPNNKRPGRPNRAFDNPGIEATTNITTEQEAPVLSTEPPAI